MIAKWKTTFTLLYVFLSIQILSLIYGGSFFLKNYTIKHILSVGDLFFRSILTPLHFLNKWFSKKILEKFLKKPPFTVLDFL